jgi:hypothetical protein
VAVLVVEVAADVKVEKLLVVGFDHQAASTKSECTFRATKVHFMFCAQG